MKKEFLKLTSKPLIHLLFTARFRVIFPLLLENRIHPLRIPVMLFSVMISLAGAPFRIMQRMLYRHRVKQIHFQKTPPLFIIGHFRSGTTFLHTLLSKDPQFGTPRIYHAFLINYCLLGGSWLKQKANALMPERRVQDNVLVSMDEPDEEEIALFCYSRHNGLTDYFFPRNPHYHNRYLLFTQEGARGRMHWEKHYQRVLQIIACSLKTNRLLLKNPFNTTRTQELSRLFPGAKFVFIIRNPYEMYLSVHHWYKSLILPLSFQVLTETELEDRILDRFRAMMAKYLSDRAYLSPGSFTEVTFEQLKQDPMKVVTAIYKTLDLPDLDRARVGMEAFLSSVEDYRQNDYSTIPDKIIRRINQDWRFVFEEWGYPLLEV